MSKHIFFPEKGQSKARAAKPEPEHEGFFCRSILVTQQIFIIYSCIGMEFNIMNGI